MRRVQIGAQGEVEHPHDPGVDEVVCSTSNAATTSPSVCSDGTSIKAIASAAGLAESRTGSSARHPSASRVPAASATAIVAGDPDVESQCPAEVAEPPLHLRRGPRPAHEPPSRPRGRDPALSRQAALAASVSSPRGGAAYLPLPRSNSVDIEGRTTAGPRAASIRRRPVPARYPPLTSAPRSCNQASGSTFLPLGDHTSKCRCGPVEMPRLPTSAITWPPCTRCPSRTE